MFETIPKIRIFINSLLISEIFIGLTIIIVMCWYQRILSSFLTESQGRMLTSKFFCVYIWGLQLVVSFLCGISLWARVWPRRYSENVQLLLCMWLKYCFLIVACGCATIWMLSATRNNLSQDVEIILLKGIDIYYINPEWKLLWDKLQYTRECCGVHGYQDWMRASWMSGSVKDYSDSDNCEALQYATSTTECPPVYMDAEYAESEPVPQIVESPQILAPYACCKRNSMFCYENYMPQRKGEGDPSRLPYLNLTDINTQGCFPLFRSYLTVVVHLLFVAMLLAVFIDFLICCLTKYLMVTNYKRGYREFINDSCMFDDEGNALVVIKCPPNVRCITLEEQNNSYSGSDIANLASSTDLCPCCNGNQDRGVDVENHLGAKNKNNLSLVH